MRSSSGYNRHFTGNSVTRAQERNIPGTSYENKFSIYNGPSSSKGNFVRHDHTAMSTPNNKLHQSPHTKQYKNTTTNSLGLIGMPKPTFYTNNSQINTASSSKLPENSSDNQLKMRKYGDLEKEKICILTGTVERVIKYGKIFQNHFCYFQVMGSVVSIADGKVQFEKIMLLRDKKGPILQLTYYSNATHINIEDFHLGQNLRAVGRMVGPNVMSAITIRAASSDEMDILHRMCYISDYAVSGLCGDTVMPSKAN